MQAKVITFLTDDYNAGMKTGRPAKYPRTPFGERIHTAREALGFSQSQVAEKLGITQMAYAFWERRPVALRPEQIAKLAEILNVSANDLLSSGKKLKHKGGPTGKARRVFEEVSKLPRSRQQRIISVVEDWLIAQQQTSKAS